jgi:hypothetical protein
MMKLSFFDGDRVNFDSLNDGFLSKPGRPKRTGDWDIYNEKRLRQREPTVRGFLW